MKPLRLSLAVPILTLATLAPTSSLSAQEENGISLAIRFTDGTSRFHVGEVIPVELSFKAPIPDTYDMEMRNYDRSGRLNIEQFHVTPPGRDPLERYYSIGGFMGGGLGGSRALSNEPQTMREDLNEWVALDKAGHYSLYVTDRKSTRLNSSHGYISYAVFCLKKKKPFVNARHASTLPMTFAEPNRITHLR